MGQAAPRKTQDEVAAELRELLGVDKLIANTRYNLGAERVTKEENGVKKDEFELRDDALMNMKGIQNTIATLRSHVDPNIILSQYQEAQVARLMEELHKQLAIELVMHWEDYGIESKSDLDKVVNIVTDNCYATYRRAIDGKSLVEIINSMTTETKVNKDINQNDQDGGGGRLLPSLG